MVQISAIVRTLFDPLFIRQLSWNKVTLLAFEKNCVWNRPNQKSHVTSRHYWDFVAFYESLSDTSERRCQNQNKSIAIMMAHYASYEWAISINTFSRFNGYAIYKKIENPYFDKLVRDIRSRFKAYLITTKETVPTIISNKNNNKISGPSLSQWKSKVLFLITQNCQVL